MDKQNNEKLSFWDRPVTDEELVDQIRSIALGKNPTAALKACEWILRGKGFLSDTVGASLDKITFEGLGDDE